MARLDFVRTPLPSDVPGYREMAAQGLLPRTPATPPAICVRPTAHRAVRKLAATAAVTAGALVLIMVREGASGQFSGAGLAAFLTTGALGAAALAVMFRRWGRAVLGELAHGYVTSTFTLGRWWAGRPAPGWGMQGRIQWDWTGVWVLTPTGQVRSAPTTGLDPPAWYPSPRAEGELELWTGHQWTNYTKPQ